MKNNNNKCIEVTCGIYGFPLGMETSGTYEDIANKVQGVIDNEI